MRALFLNTLHDDGTDQILVTGESAHHFIKVLRLKIDEEVLLLNGAGLSAVSKVASFSKSEMVLSVGERQLKNRNLQVSLALGLPKKEALESVIKASGEMGIKEIIPLETKYSQKLEFNEERIQRILISSIEQSNNPYLPEFRESMKWSELKSLVSSFDETIYFTSQNSPKPPTVSKSLTQKILIVIGPEGGFSPEEEEALQGLQQVSNCHGVKLPLPIMRTPTATCVAMGYIISRLLNN